MSLSYFYIKDVSEKTIVLDEETSKHIIQVLRKKAGETILLTDGKGTKATAVIKNDNRKKCEVTIESREKEEAPERNISIAISLIKNTSRFEWFLEKATEIGVTEIIPILCDRTESEKFRHDRLNGILISAMLQSQQCWLPTLHQPTPFAKVCTMESAEKYIAHCLKTQKTSLVKQHQTTATDVGKTLILIGPEGDFSEGEIELALAKNFVPVTLGNTRLRTETAGLVAAVLLCNNY